MSPIGVVVVLCALFCVLVVFRTGHRMGAVAVLMVAALFCLYGFIASFEFPGITVWKVGYATVGLASAVAAGRLLFVRSAT